MFTKQLPIFIVFILLLSRHQTYGAHFASVKSVVPEDGQSIQEEQVYASRHDISMTRIVGIQVNLHMHNRHDIDPILAKDGPKPTPNPLPETVEAQEPPILSPTDTMDVREIHTALAITFRHLEAVVPSHSVDFTNLKILISKLEYSLKVCNDSVYAQSNTDHPTTRPSDNSSESSELQASRELEKDAEEEESPPPQHVHVLLAPRNVESAHANDSNLTISSPQHHDSESNETYESAEQPKVAPDDSAEPKEPKEPNHADDLESPTNEGETLVQLVEHLIREGTERNGYENETEIVDGLQPMHRDTVSTSEEPVGSMHEIRNHASQYISPTQNTSSSESEEASGADKSSIDSEERHRYHDLVSHTGADKSSIESEENDNDSPSKHNSTVHVATGIGFKGKHSEHASTENTSQEEEEHEQEERKEETVAADTEESNRYHGLVSEATDTESADKASTESEENDGDSPSKHNSTVHVVTGMGFNGKNSENASTENAPQKEEDQEQAKEETVTKSEAHNKTMNATNETVIN